MIAATSITAWRNQVQWLDDAQVEQDLILSRALIDIFSDPFLKDNLAFRGGTALHKLIFQPAGRYSEDLDLCRTTTGPARPILDRLHAQLNPWLGTPRVDRTNRAVTLRYAFQPENGGSRKRVKVEINVREHYNRFGLKTIAHQVANPWFTGQAHIVTYSVEELLATKLRALYQRRKGRDLFDLSEALLLNPPIDVTKVIEGFQFYMNHLNLTVSRSEFEENLEQKEADGRFRNDITPLLTPGRQFDFDVAYVLVSDEILSHLP